MCELYDLFSGRKSYGAQCGRVTNDPFVNFQELDDGSSSESSEDEDAELPRCVVFEGFVHSMVKAIRRYDTGAVESACKYEKGAQANMRAKAGATESNQN